MTRSRPDHSPTAPKILLLDFWSDHNRGDAAMQIALVDMVREHAPSAELTVMAAYGANQWPAFRPEFDETEPRVDGIVGGFRPTFVPFDSKLLRRPLPRKALNGLGALSAVLLLPLLALAVRRSRWDRLLPRSLRAPVRAVRDADLILWNGRNFRSDSARREPYEIWTLLYNPLVAAFSAAPIATIGLSIWPLRRRISRWMLGGVLKRVSFASAREQSSFERAQRLVGRKRADRVHLLPDLSLGAIPLPDETVDRADGPATPKRIGVTLVDWVNGGYDARDRYVRALRGAIGTWLEDPDVTVSIIPQVTYDMEATATIEADVLEGLPAERVTIVAGTPTVQSLVEGYSTLDLLVATRMHSAIFATVQGTPVVTIPYDEGGKWGILDMLGARDIDVPFRIATTELLQAKIDDAWGRRHATREEVRRRLPALRSAVQANVTTPLAMHGLLEPTEPSAS